MTVFHITYVEEHDGYEVARGEHLTAVIDTADVAADVLAAVKARMEADGCTVLGVDEKVRGILYYEPLRPPATERVKRELLLTERDTVLYAFHELHKTGCMIVRMADAWGNLQGAPFDG